MPAWFGGELRGKGPTQVPRRAPYPVIMPRSTLPAAAETPSRRAHHGLIESLRGITSRAALLAQVVDNVDGIVLDHGVHVGNPPDGPLLKPAVERIKKLVGRAPKAVTADRGYGDAQVDTDLKKLGVK